MACANHYIPYNIQVPNKCFGKRSRFTRGTGVLPSAVKSTNCYKIMAQPYFKKKNFNLLVIHWLQKTKQNKKQQQQKQQQQQQGF